MCACLRPTASLFIPFSIPAVISAVKWKWKLSKHLFTFLADIYLITTRLDFRLQALITSPIKQGINERVTIVFSSWIFNKQINVVSFVNISFFFKFFLDHPPSEQTYWKHTWNIVIKLIINIYKRLLAQSEARTCHETERSVVFMFLMFLAIILWC